jgi:enoyl-CoA hydratase/carnithine racemase
MVISISGRIQTVSVIELARDGHIATVTINRAERRNAVTLEMMQDLERIRPAW